MFWKTKKFKELQRKWYGKLRKDGFKDLEINPTHQHLETARVADAASVYEYYSLVGEYLEHGRFDSAFDKDVWKYHSDGDSFRQIADKLQTNKNKVMKTVSKYLIKSGIVKV